MEKKPELTEEQYIAKRKALLDQQARWKRLAAHPGNTLGELHMSVTNLSQTTEELAILDTEWLRQRFENEALRGATILAATDKRSGKILWN